MSYEKQLKHLEMQNRVTNRFVSDCLTGAGPVYCEIAKERCAKTPDLMSCQVMQGGMGVHGNVFHRRSQYSHPIPPPSGQHSVPNGAPPRP